MKKLQEMRAQRKLNNKGFSLVELIIVIAIMAVLIAILAPQFIKYVEKSRKSADVSTVQEIIDAVQAYAADSEGLDVSSNNTVTLDIDGISVQDGDVKDALDEHKANGGKLKSKKWGVVSITFTNDTNGNLQYEVTNDTGSSHTTNTTCTKAASGYEMSDEFKVD